MNQNDPTCKPFERPKLDASQLPPLLAELLGGHTLLPEMTADDLREMSKFGEIPNVEGLAAHPVEHPLAQGDGDRPARIDFAREVSTPFLKALHRELTSVHSLVVRGALGGASLAPFNVQIVMPQFGAQLALALTRRLWPLGDLAAPASFTLFLWPRPLKDKYGRLLAGNWAHQPSGGGFGMAIGNDELELAEALLRTAAEEFWETRPGMRRVAAGVGVATVDHAAGTASIKSAGDEDRAVDHAVSEDYLVEDEEWLSPVWANPRLPAAGLAEVEALRRAALEVGSILLGVASDGEGMFPLLHRPQEAMAARDDGRAMDPGGCAIVPRAKLPAPWMSEARRWKLAQ